MFNFIITDGQYVGFENKPNKFLNDIFQLSHHDFEAKLLQNVEFKKNLIKEMTNYSYFTGIYHPDSVQKYLDIQLQKSKNVYGYAYSLKYRINNILHTKMLLFDRNNIEIIKSN